MANTLLTSTKVTRKALQILHQKLRFIGSINRQYDDSFAQSGAKIGNTLKIRLPNEYTVTDGAVMTAQDSAESSVDLVVGTQKHVGMNFTSQDFTLSIDDFAQRYLEPAMSVLAAKVEADAYSMYKDVANLVDNDGVAVGLVDFLNGGRLLKDNLTPDDSQWIAMLGTRHEVKLVDTLKGLFQSSEKIASQYIKGEMGMAAGFSFKCSTHVTDHLTGTAAEGDTLYNVNGAGQTGASIAVDTGVTTFKKGDVITFAGCNAVHQETKTDLGYARQFVLTADYVGGAGNLLISPSIVVTGAKQNCTASPTTTGAVTKVGAGNAELLNSTMVYNKNAFAIAFADLEMPKNQHFAAREVYDGISLRIVGGFDITNDKFPYRADVFYGYKTIRPQIAARIHADG